MGESVSGVTGVQLYMGMLSGYRIEGDDKNALDLLAPAFGDSKYPSWIGKTLAYGATVAGGLATALGVGYSGATLVSYAANRSRKKDIKEIAEASRLYSREKVIEPDMFAFDEVEGRLSFIRSRDRSDKVKDLRLSAQDLIDPKAGAGQSGARYLQNAYQTWASRVNSYFLETFSGQLDELVSGRQTWEGLRASVTSEQAVNSLRQALKATVGTNEARTFYEVFFEQGKGRNEQKFIQDLIGPKTTLAVNQQKSYGTAPLARTSEDEALIKKYIRDLGGSKSLVSQLIDKAKTIWGKQKLDRYSPEEQKARLLKDLEATDEYQRLVARLEQPTSAERQISLQTPETYEGYRRASNVEPRSQGIIREGLRGLGGATSLTASWVGTGRDVVQMTEGLALTFDQSKSQYMQQRGAESFVRAGIRQTLGVGAQVAARYLSKSISARFGFAAGGMVGGLPGALIGGAIGVGISIGVDYFLTPKLVNWLGGRSSERDLIEHAGEWLSQPQQKLTGTLEALGLSEKTAERTGNVAGTLMKPISASLGAVSGVATNIWENTAVPWLKDQWQSTRNSGSLTNLLRNFFVPRTAYYNRRRSYFKQSARRRLMRSFRVNRGLSTDTVHPLILGQAQDQREWLMSQKYFQGQSRLLSSEFGAHHYEPSNIMRLALERQQGLYDMRVVGSATKRLGRDQKGAGLWGAVGVSLVGSALAGLFQNREKLRYLTTGHSSQRVRKKALSEIESLEQMMGLEKGTVKTEFKKQNLGQRRKMWGQYRPDTAEVTLARSVENALGAGSGGAKLEARFTVLHELTHHKQTRRQAPTASASELEGNYSDKINVSSKKQAQ
ncbi:MAG: hypothetical protein ABEK59_11955, partial [Halobacteria archaeon]